VSAVPARDHIVDISDFLIDVARMPGIAGKAALNLFADHLTEADLGGWLGNALKQLLGRGRAQVMQATGCPGREHLDAGEIRRHFHVVIGEMRQNSKYEMREPILEQKAVSQAFEEVVIEMLMGVDEPGDYDHSGCVDGAISGHLGQLPGPAYTFDHRSIDEDKAAGMDAAVPIDGHHIAALDQHSGHWPATPDQAAKIVMGGARADIGVTMTH
jgi:hypothetical protein